MGEEITNQISEQNLVLSANSSASKTDQIDGLVNILLTNCREASRPKPGRGMKAALPGRDLPGRDLTMYKSWLGEAHRHFHEASSQEVSLSYASEWVLDNYYIIRQALLQIKEDLPSGFYNQLPRLSGGPLKDFPRIYAIARTVLSVQHQLLDPIDLQTILIQFQKRVPLTMGELWAMPIFLRYSLIEYLAHALVETIHPSKLPNLPVPAPQILASSDLILSGETATGEPTENNGVANIILSLRTISEQNWSDFFESVSSLEQTLRDDPAGMYSKMDFKTRDLYRKEIETLSFDTGIDESELAEIIISLARSNVSGRPSDLKKSAVSSTSPVMDAQLGPDGLEKRPDNPNLNRQAAHVGEILLGKGRAALEQRIGYHPDMKTAFQRWGFRNASAVYLSSVLLLTILIFMALALAARLPDLIPRIFPSSGNFPWAAGTFIENVVVRWVVVILLIFILIVPVLTVATSLVNWLITLLVKPRILPKLDFKKEIPDSFHTLVVIPAMITNRDDIDSLTHQIELHYLRNPEPGLLFALLTDFSDADSEVLPEDEDLVQYAVAAVKTLNLKYETSSPGEGSDAVPGSRKEIATGSNRVRRFYFLHRKRLWNPSERKWIGWERKRGKLHELNSLLRGGKTFLSSP